MERPYILHLFTPERHASPFGVNMAADAGYHLVVPYPGVTLVDVPGLTQDAIFSRGPHGAARTGLFIGGRDAVLATDMLDAVRQAMVPPYEVSVMADPRGAYTTAAALLAAVERQLRRAHNSTMKGLRVLVLGGTGPVGRATAVLAARLGAARVAVGSHRGEAPAQQAAQDVQRRFGVSLLQGVGTQDRQALHQALQQAEVVLATAAAGVPLVRLEDWAIAPHLRVAADVNTVLPAGLAGVELTDDGRRLMDTKAVLIGAQAIAEIKYRTQHRLLLRMRLREAQHAQTLGLFEAFAVARVVAGEADATAASWS